LYSLTKRRGKKAGIMSIPSLLGIAVGGLGSVSTNNNATLTYLKHLGISNVQLANSVTFKLLLLHFTSVYFTFLHLTSPPDV